MSLSGLDQWKQTEPEQDASHGLGCPCSDCEREKEARDAEYQRRFPEQGVSPRMAMRRRRDDK